MFWLLIAGIVLIGLVFIIAEVLFMPGGILGVVGGFLVIFAMYLPYYHHLGRAANISLVIILLVLVITLFTSIKTKTWRHLELSTDITSKVRRSNTVKIGDEGQSVSRLAPMGKAKFNNKFVEVKSFSGFIDPHTDIEIVDIIKNKIIVKPLKKE